MAEAADQILSGPERRTARERRHNEGHGRRLTAAFEALEGFPALAEARRRLLTLLAEGDPAPAEVVAAVESDVALTIAVLRIANHLPGRRRGRVESVAQAVEALTPQTVHAIADRAETFDFFEPALSWQGIPDRFALHAGTTRLACNRLARELRTAAGQQLLAAALLHDIGTLVLIQAYPGYPLGLDGDATTPEERLERERRELGIDHAVVGGVLARRWGLPDSLARAIERHHEEDADKDATLVRLADMIAHYAIGDTISAEKLLAVAHRATLRPTQLREVMYDVRLPATGQVHPPAAGSPLSSREVQVLHGLAQGRVYKQIASDLGLSTSTVRSHLHNIYGKLGAGDRAQAVLIATERGWI
jgi:putative nucleotidyltransferase with HDIG domain